MKSLGVRLKVFNRSIFGLERTCTWLGKGVHFHSLQALRALFFDLRRVERLGVQYLKMSVRKCSIFVLQTLNGTFFSTYIYMFTSHNIAKNVAKS